MSGSFLLLRLSSDLLVSKKISISENTKRSHRPQTLTALPLDGVVNLSGQSKEQRRMSMQFLDMTPLREPTKLQLRKSSKLISIKQSWLDQTHTQALRSQRVKSKRLIDWQERLPIKKQLKKVPIIVNLERNHPRSPIKNGLLPILRRQLKFPSL